MPIRILDSPEPCSKESLDLDRECILVQSDASRLLIQELRRYRDRQATGRSFLIAGHRGSGKTTLVLDAFLRVWKESHRLGLPRRLLLVPLHGPSLLINPDEAKAAPAGETKAKKKNGDEEDEDTEDAGDKPAKSAPDADDDTETQRALKQITLGLYRSLATEVAIAYRQRILEVPADDPRGQRRREELLEQAAQLHLELYECSGLAHLREFWSRGGFLRQGVLFRSSTPQADQGLLELIAVSSACEAYKRIAGTYTSKEERTDSAESKESRSRELNTAKQDVLSPMITLLTGGLVGAGLFASGSGGMLSTLTGLVAALGASMVFKASSSRSRERAVKREQTFLPDLRVATLDRVLPLLCERIADAGLLPVFMVDELDKVENLSERMGGMVRHLKKFVAESAFFCFLTDRSYYEEMRRRVATSAHPREQTYFKHPLFVVFSAKDLHAYLGHVLEKPKPAMNEPAPPAPEPVQEKKAAPNTSGSVASAVARVAGAVASAVAGDVIGAVGNAAGAVAAAADVVASRAAQQALAVEQAKREVAPDLADYPLLSYILLHRSNMHASELQRVLASIRNEDNQVAIPPGLVRSSRAYRFDVLIQLAIELIMERPALRDRLDRDPDFRMVAHDALYDPTRAWVRGEEKLTLDDAAEDAFRTRLQERMKEDKQAGPPPLATPAANGNMISTPDVKFLFSQTRELAVLLSNPQRMKSELEQREPKIEQVILDALPLQTPLAPLLEAIKDTEHCYRWRYDHSGRDLQPTPIAPAGAAASPETVDASAWEQSAWEMTAKFIRSCTEMLKELSENRIDMTALASQCWIIKTSPAWEEVERAMGRLERFRKLPDPKTFGPHQEQDVAVITEFMGLLMRSGETIGRALFCAAGAGSAVGAGTAAESGSAVEPSKLGERMVLGLRAMADNHRFNMRPQPEVDAALRKLSGEIAARFGLDRNPPDLKLNAFSIASYKKNVKDWIALIDGKTKAAPVNRPVLRQETWQLWLNRMEQYMIESRDVFDPDLLDILCAAAGMRPSNLLRLRLEEMTINAWSKALYWSLIDESHETADQCPSWLLIPAVRALGFNMNSASTWYAGIDSPFPNIYKLRKRADDESSRLRSWIGTAMSRQSRTPQDAALIIRQSGPSLTNDWKPSPRYAAMSFSRRKVAFLNDSDFADARRLIDQLQIRHVVIEEPTPSETNDAVYNLLSRSRLPWVLPRIWRMYKTTPDWKDGRDQLIAPRDPDHMFEMIKAMSSQQAM